MEWGGATTIVTGASRGIGLALARASAGRGARVGLIARRDAFLAVADQGTSGAVKVALDPAR